MKYVALVLLIAGCNASGPVRPSPMPPPSPLPPIADASPPKPPPPPIDDCQREADALARMHCPEWHVRYAEDCRTADEKLHELPGGHAPINHACVIGSGSCASARSCR